MPLMHLDSPFTNLTYAMAAVDTYRVYGGSPYIAKAISLWDVVSQSQISAADIAHGQHDGINFSIPCAADEPVSSLVGGIPTWVSFLHLCYPSRSLRSW
jgi:hypothetical protein